ncbi:PKD domain-containing protein [Myxococcota bacterium]|nr:PKD domain-containing protein [Myxococcota bacterium]
MGIRSKSFLPRGVRALLVSFSATLAAATLVSGCGDSSTASPGLTAAIGVTPETGNAPTALTFTARHTGALDAEVTFAWDFGDGATGEGKEVEHTFEAAGTYTVRVVVTDTALGTAEATLDVEIAPSADLRVEQVNVGNRNARPGGELVVTGGLANDGAEPIGEWRVAFVLSTDQSLSADDLRLDARPREGGPSGPLESFEVTLTLPEDLASGEYYAGVVADDEGVIGDADRSNNVGWSGFPVDVRNATDTGPDLVLCGLTLPAFEGLRAGDRPQVQQGDQLEVSVCLANLGDEPTLDASVELLLSRDDRPSDDDLVLYQRTELVLGMGQNRFEEATVVDLPIELELGAWYVLAVADRADVVVEQSEDNNLRASREPVDVVEPGEVEGVDLVVTAFSSSATRAFWGQTFPVELAVVNRGRTPVQRNFVVRIEAEPTDGRAAVTVASLNVGGLPAGETAALDSDVTVTRRIEPGEYCLRAHADPTGSANDANPGNNRRRAGCLQLGGEPTFDLSVRDVTVDPAEVDAGGRVRVGATIQNLGADPTGPVPVVVVFSADDRVDAADRIVDRFDNEGVTPGTDSVVDRMVEVPLDLDRAVGRWRVAVVADPETRLTGDAVRENNTAFSPTTLVVNGAMGGCAEDEENEENDRAERATPLSPGLYPELGLCDGADWFSVEVPAGAALVVQVEVSELAFAAAGTVPSLVVEGMGGIALVTADVYERSATAVVEPAAVARTLRLGLTSPVAMPYALEVEVLPGEGAINLRPRGLTVAPAVAAAGAFVNVGLDVVNLGGDPAGPTTAQLTFGPRGDAAGTALATLDVPAVPAGGVVRVEHGVALPAEAVPGPHWVEVALDAGDTVAEASEDDNGARAAVTVAAEGACPADPFEPNRSDRLGDGGRAVAAELGAGTYDGLSVCGSEDDWYAIGLAPGEGLTVEAEFIGAEGDVDLYFFAPDGVTELASSRSGVANIERIEFFGSPQGGVHFLRVVVRPGAGGAAVQTTYDLSVTLDPPGGCEPDAFDPNASEDAAAVVVDGDYVLSLCPGAADWFRFSLVAGNTVSFQARSDANLHLRLYDPSGAIVDEDDLTVVWDAEVDGLYLLEVSTVAAVPVGYSLRVRGASGIDLQVTDLEVAPEAASAGDELRVSGAVRNSLGDTLQNVSVRFLLSDDDLPSVNDRELGRLVLPRVGNLDPATFRTRLRLPRDVAPGDRNVIAEVDPERLLGDARRADNALAVPVRIRDACVDDDPRSNEGPATATLVTLEQASVEAVICGYTEDWYRLVVPEAGTLGVALVFDAAAADLDLTVYDAAAPGTPVLAASATEASPEALTIEGPAEVFLRVDGFLDAEGGYALRWTLQ